MLRVCFGAAVVFCGSMALARPQSTWFVDDDAASGGDGTSWSSAFQFLQDALAAAAPGDEVRVAGGTYRADEGGGQSAGDRDATFVLDGLTIAGAHRGLAGGGSADDRDLLLFATLVTGDLAHDDPSRSDNSKKLFVLAGDAVLDGLVVAAADDPYWGVAVDAQFHDLTLRDCEFRDHGQTACGGGATISAQRCWFHRSHAAISGATIELSDCTLEDHTDSAVIVGWSLSAERCAFRRNVTQELGGAVLAYDADVTLEDCIVEDNASTGSGFEGGGAVTMFDSGVLRLHRSRFSRNSCDYLGGAVYCLDVPFEATECTFEDNHSDAAGGALCGSDARSFVADCRFLRNSGSYGAALGLCAIESIVRCEFVGNQATFGSGAVDVAHYGGTIPVVDCTFERNTGKNVSALRISPIWKDALALERCTFADNTATDPNGTAVSASPMVAGSFRVTDCILFDNDRNGVEDETAQLAGPAGAIAIDRSCVEGWTGALGGTGNFGSDPLFVDPANGRFDLQPVSPCVEAGDPGYAPAAGFERDVAGNVRVLDAQLDRTPRLDLGAYEFTHARLTLSGDPHPGGTLTVTLEGTAGLPALMFLGFGEAALTLEPLGVVFVDLGVPFLLLPWPSAPSQVTGDLPADVVTPLTFFLQAVVFQAPSGNLSNLVRVDVR